MSNKRYFSSVFVASLCVVVIVSGLLLASSSGAFPSYDPWLDVNNDGKVDMRDIGAVCSGFGGAGAVTPRALRLFDSGWLDISDKAGQSIVIAHNLHDADVIVDIMGKTGVNDTEMLRRPDLNGTGYLSRTYGGPNYDEAHSIAPATDGGYLVAGDTRITVFDPDFYAVKTDSSGNMQWSRRYGGPDWDRAASVIQTQDGGYAIVGYTRSFGAGGQDMWLIKTDSDGNAQWNKTYGGADYDGGTRVIQTSDGGFALSGYTVSFGNGGQDFWLVKTDANGNMEWNNTYGGPSEDYANVVVQTNDGNYVLLGSTESFGAGMHDAWLIKTDAAGNMLWNETFGGSDEDWGVGLIQTSEGGLAFTSNTRSFGAGMSDGWLVKTDSEGNLQWNKTYGGTEDDGINTLVQKSDGGYALAGGTASSGAGGEDAWLISTGQSGNMLWNSRFGGARSDFALAILRESDDVYVLVGETESFGSGMIDAWLVKNVGNEIGLGWIDLSPDSVTLYKGANDPYWNYLRVQIWKTNTP